CTGPNWAWFPYW
nr:immunoglobulin heavy chain junction region [Mus musculus]